MTTLSWLVGLSVLVVFLAPEWVQRGVSRVHRQARRFLDSQED